MSTPTKRARYVSKQGFICSEGNHVLYCPTLIEADKSKSFFLTCIRHNMMFEIDLSSKEAADFIADFPRGCKDSSLDSNNAPKGFKIKQ